MPYKTKGKCVYKKDTGEKVGCTDGSVKKYLAALHANANEGLNVDIKGSDLKQIVEEELQDLLKEQVDPADITRRLQGRSAGARTGEEGGMTRADWQGSGDARTPHKEFGAPEMTDDGFLVYNNSAGENPRIVYVFPGVTDSGTGARDQTAERINANLSAYPNTIVVLAPRHTTSWESLRAAGETALGGKIPSSKRLVGHSGGAMGLADALRSGEEFDKVTYADPSPKWLSSAYPRYRERLGLSGDPLDHSRSTMYYNPENWRGSLKSFGPIQTELAIEMGDDRAHLSDRLEGEGAWEHHWRILDDALSDAMYDAEDERATAYLRRPDIQGVELTDTVGLPEDWEPPPADLGAPSEEPGLGQRLKNRLTRSSKMNITKEQLKRIIKEEMVRDAKLEEIAASPPISDPPRMDASGAIPADSGPAGGPTLGSSVSSMMKKLGTSGSTTAASKFQEKPLQRAMDMVTDVLSKANERKKREFLVTLLDQLGIDPQTLSLAKSELTALQQDRGPAAPGLGGEPTLQEVRTSLASIKQIIMEELSVVSEGGKMGHYHGPGPGRGEPDEQMYDILKGERPPPRARDVASLMPADNTEAGMTPNYEREIEQLVYDMSSSGMSKEQIMSMVEQSLDFLMK